MNPAAWILAVIAVVAAGLAYFADRKNRRLRGVNAQLSRDMVVLEGRYKRWLREDAQRIRALRRSLDAANTCNSHFVEWSTEKPVDPTRGGEPS